MSDLNNPVGLKIRPQTGQSSGPSSYYKQKQLKQRNTYRNAISPYLHEINGESSEVLASHQKVLHHMKNIQQGKSVNDKTKSELLIIRDLILEMVHESMYLVRKELGFTLLLYMLKP